MNCNYNIIFATNNRHKVNEINSISCNFSLTINDQSNYHIQSPIEDGKTFIENALIKANNTFRYTKQPVIADDSGICVEALDGAPGIYSARYASPSATDKENRTKLLNELQKASTDNFIAKFACAAVFIDDRLLEPFIAYEEWPGLIIKEEVGQNGFGYDPIFYDPSLGLTASEMTQSQKNMVSHRGKAFKKLFEQIAKHISS
jgi:XTP/dITP diphosphohydrolase